MSGRRFNDLIKLSVEATTVGLFKNMLTDTAGHVVPRKTLQTLRQNELIGSGKAGGFGVSEYGLGRHWWSVFFEDNAYYNDVLSAELYANDESDLFKYISSSFYQSPFIGSVDNTDTVLEFPPSTPYADFNTIHSEQKNRCAEEGRGPYSNPSGTGYDAYCKRTYQYWWKGEAQSKIDRRYADVFSSDGDPENAFREGGLRGLVTRDGWVRKLLNHLYGDGKREGDCNNCAYKKKLLTVERFRDAYRFLSNINIRSEYDDFLERVGSAFPLGIWFSIIEQPYTRKNSHWEKQFSTEAVPSLHGTSPSDSFASYSALYSALQESWGEIPTTGSSITVQYPAQYNKLYANLFNGSLSTGLRRKAVAMQVLRGIYEGTLAAHIELVGTPDEYSGSVFVNPHALAYRNEILDGKRGSEIDQWRIVREETLRRFRDGNFDVYVPVNGYLDNRQGNCVRLTDVRQSFVWRFIIFEWFFDSE